MKSSSLAYNRRETRDKPPLGRDPDKSWCHLPTSVKLPWSQPTDRRTERQHTRTLPPMSMEPWAATKKALHWCSGGTSSCPGPYPTAASPEFHKGNAENFLPCPCIRNNYNCSKHFLPINEVCHPGDEKLYMLD